VLTRRTGLAANPTAMLSQMVPFARNEAKTLIADRGMLVVDTVLATAAPLIVQIVLWAAIFRNGGGAEAFTYQGIVTYFSYATALGRMNNGYDIVERLSNYILEGTLEAKVVRPLPLPLQLLSGFLGGSVIYLGLIAVAFGVDLLWRGGQLPIAGIGLLAHIFGVAAVLLMSQLLTFLLAFCLGVAAFRFKRTDLLLSVLLLAQATLGGLLLPPSLWEGPVRALMENNPFRFVIATPAEVLGSWQLDAAGHALLPASIYIAVLSVLAGVLWKRALRSYNGAGG
jgi:ABC-2 type transport system permease protein